MAPKSNGFELHDGIVVTNLTLANGQPPGGDATTPDLFTLDPALFSIGTNVLAVEVHQNQLSSSDITFGLQLTADRAASSNAFAWPRRVPPIRCRQRCRLSRPLWLNEVQAENLPGRSITRESAIPGSSYSIPAPTR